MQVFPSCTSITSEDYRHLVVVHMLQRSSINIRGFLSSSSFHSSNSSSSKRKGSDKGEASSSSMAPLLQALLTMSLDLKQKMERLFDIAYFIAIREINRLMFSSESFISHFISFSSNCQYRKYKNRIDQC